MHFSHQMKEFIDFCNSGKFPDDNNRRFHFRDCVIVPEAIMLNLFWVYFYKAIVQISTKVLQKLYKSFTSDEMQGNSSHMLQFLT